MATPAKRLFRPPREPTGRPGWSTSRPIYRPRQPTATPLYPVVQHHLETFVAQAAESDPLGHGVPAWVEEGLPSLPTGGITPKWARSGRELFFVNAAGEMVASEVTTQGGAFEVAGWRTLFNLRERGLDAAANYASWDVDVDDQHFLMVQFGGDDPDERPNEFILVQNWIEEVKARLGR